ncbi:dnaJ homolog subfamily C member 8-like isoform X2 [Clavelina lepadiformis]|uniref:dnaJ homolog subfamily C member 8-like isoform X2 n=1 Tax=Clavelina lepadiformis TaxID=159417 RepID=UPI0040436441
MICKAHKWTIASQVCHTAEVKQIEKADAVLTPKQQIERLNRPGSTYFNLNPFDVLQVAPETPQSEIKSKYRKLSILVHPDKNPDDEERAKKAFDAVKKSWETLSNDKERTECLGVVEDAQNRLETKLKNLRKKLKKEGKTTEIPEDDPDVYAVELHKETCKLFADLALVRKEMEMREMNERKRQRQAEIELEEKSKMQKEWNKNYEESREGRISSWQDFKSGKTTKKRKAKPAKGFKPPKVKMEQR